MPEQREDFQAMDPTYTMYEATAAASARKLYKILKGDPNALKSISWGKLGDWLTKNRINYKTHFSVYR